MSATPASGLRVDGGIFTDLDGGTVGLATTSVLATNGVLHPHILRAVGG